MNETEILTFKNQMSIMNSLNYIIMSLEKEGLTEQANLTIKSNMEQITETLKALAPANKEFGFKDSVSTPKTSEVKNE